MGWRWLGKIWQLTCLRLFSGSPSFHHFTNKLPSIVQVTPELNLAAVIGHRLVARFYRWNASFGLPKVLAVWVMEWGHLLRIEWYLNYTHSSAGGERWCLEVAIDERLPSCYHTDVNVINAKSTAAERHGEVTVVKLPLECRTECSLWHGSLEKIIQILETLLSSIVGWTDVLSSHGNITTIIKT